MHSLFLLLFFFNDTPTTHIYTLSLHDALPISPRRSSTWSVSPCSASVARSALMRASRSSGATAAVTSAERSEEHTSELQSHSDLVCRLLLEKKKKQSETAEVTDYKLT